MMVSNKPVFKVIELVDPEKLKDLPQIEILADRAPSQIPAMSQQTPTESPNGSNQSIDPRDTASTASLPRGGGEPIQSMVSRISAGSHRFPPVPALVVGLFLLVAMIIGD